MKKRVTTATVIFAIAIMVFAVSAFAQTETTTPPPRPSYGPGSCSWGYNSSLNLTEDQQQKLSDLMKKNVIEGSKIRTETQLKHIELMELYSADKPDLKKIDKVDKEIRDLRDKQYELKKKFRDSARGLLTKKQLEDNPYAFVRRGHGMRGSFGGMSNYGKGHSRKGGGIFSRW